MPAFAVSHLLSNFIWWWLFVEYKLVQNIKVYTWIVFAGNDFEFTSGGNLL